MEREHSQWELLPVDPRCKYCGIGLDLDGLHARRFLEAKREWEFVCFGCYEAGRHHEETDGAPAEVR